MQKKNVKLSSQFQIDFSDHAMLNPHSWTTFIECRLRQYIKKLSDRKKRVRYVQQKKSSSVDAAADNEESCNCELCTTHHEF